ncbi:hypothetical protein KGF57_002189 [Candida theae]|uniref:Uncharacterized protein n=1 Tax=Candida theae TaxID=1198502 RepID=A0AAD5FZ07_9ASCO|nr:uncharacterized protein KGF57_002189 [Candida theae]KAI5959251.1 hypothetical protein KGF57_002189 [Candida theae]
MDYILITDSSQGFSLTPLSFLGMKICLREVETNETANEFVTEYGIIEHDDDDSMSFFSFLLGWIQKFDSKSLTEDQLQEFIRISSSNIKYGSDNQHVFMTHVSEVS